MKNGNPKVSVIVPVYNITSYIQECVTSIQKQTYRNIEIILIDDGSTDGSGELCEKLAKKDGRIQVIRQENKGVVSARNRGIKASSGIYISFIDGDDWIEPDMIEVLLNQIGEADLITTKVCRELTSGKWIEECDKFPEGLYSGEKLSIILDKMIYDFENECVQPLIPGMCNKLYASDLVKKVYRTLDTNITYEEDAVFTYKCLLQCSSIVVSHQSFYHYQYRKGSAIHSVTPHMLMDINRVYFVLKRDFEEHKRRDQLLLQLQRWIMYMSCRAINDFMGFDPRISITEYIANLSYLEDKSLILYGAGKAGQDTYAQMSQYGYHVVLWADRNYQTYQEKGMPVVSPDEIFHTEYDLIFIAVGDETLAESIKKDLVRRGIPEEVLIWRKPMHVF